MARTDDRRLYFPRQNLCDLNDPETIKPGPAILQLFNTNSLHRALLLAAMDSLAHNTELHEM